MLPEILNKDEYKNESIEDSEKNVRRSIVC